MKKYILFIFLFSCTKMDIGHTCKWWSCPYKGITLQQYPQKAEDDQGTDAYILDSLHIVYPKDEYEELEDKLFKIN